MVTSRLRIGEERFVELLTQEILHDPDMTVVAMQQALHRQGYAASFERVSRLRPLAHLAALRLLHAHYHGTGERDERDGEVTDS